MSFRSTRADRVKTVHQRARTRYAQSSPIEERDASYAPVQDRKNRRPTEQVRLLLIRDVVTPQQKPAQLAVDHGRESQQPPLWCTVGGHHDFALRYSISRFPGRKKYPPPLVLTKRGIGESRTGPSRVGMV